MKISIKHERKTFKRSKEHILDKINRNIECDHHVKHVSKIHSTHMSMQDCMQNIQALTTQPLTEAIIQIKGTHKVAGKE